MALVTSSLNGNAVEYDNGEFEVLKEAKNVYLHYVGNGSNITNPKGNTSCYRMFEDFEGTNLDLSKFNTSEITNMSFMFHTCMNLEHLNLSNFNTNKVTYMSFMFHACMNLKTLNISNFDTENVIDMSYMFWNCNNLKELDISSFYIDNTKMLDNMFWDCRSLKTLKVSYDCLQFFSMNRGLLDIGNNVNIIPVSKLDKAVNDLFY